MSQPGPRQTKKQKKALAFRTGQKTGKKKKVIDDDDALGFPVDENQDLAGVADLPLEAEEVPTGGRSGGRKGKAQDTGHHQVQPGGSKKRKREGEDDVEEKPRKRTKAHPVVSKSGVEDDEECQELKKKKAQPQRFILFIGAFLLPHFESSKGSSTTAVGNLKYSTAKDAIIAHFSSCGTYGALRA
jgi:hypothetical protein